MFCSFISSVWSMLRCHIYCCRCVAIYGFFFFPSLFSFTHPTRVSHPRPRRGEAATRFRTTEENASRPRRRFALLPVFIRRSRRGRKRRNPQNEALTEQEELASFPLDLVRKLTLTFVGAVQYKCGHQGARHPFSSFLRPFSSPRSFTSP